MNTTLKSIIILKDFFTFPSLTKGRVFTPEAFFEFFGVTNELEKTVSLMYLETCQEYIKLEYKPKKSNKVYKQIQVDVQIFDFLRKKKGTQTWDEFFESIKIYLPDSNFKNIH